MHIRFGHQELGNWKYNCGDFQKRLTSYLCIETHCIFVPHNRMLEDDLGMGMCEMTCTLNIRADLISGTLFVPYKYYIVSPGAKRDQDKCFEVLCSHRGTITNRCLKLEKDVCKGMCLLHINTTWLFIIYVISIPVYHKFDNIVCPTRENSSGKTKTLLERGKNWVLSKIGMAGKEVEETATPVSFELLSQPNKLNELCLHLYLDKYKHCLLEGHCGESPNLVAMVEKVLHVYNSLRVQVTTHQDCSTKIVDENHTADFHHVRNTCLIYCMHVMMLIMDCRK